MKITRISLLLFICLIYLFFNQKAFAIVFPSEYWSNIYYTYSSFPANACYANPCGIQMFDSSCQQYFGGDPVIDSPAGYTLTGSNCCLISGPGGLGPNVVGPYTQCINTNVRNYYNGSFNVFAPDPSGGGAVCSASGNFVGFQCNIPLPTPTPTPVPLTPTPTPVPLWKIDGVVYYDVNNNGVLDG